MFGLFRRPKPETVAARLSARADQVVRQYLRLPTDQLEARLRRDFPASFQVDPFRMAFDFPDDPDFRFVIDLGDPTFAVADRYLTVFGQRRHCGFMLSASDDGPWVCSATDMAPTKRATRQALALARHFDEKLSVRDISASMCAELPELH